MLSGAHLNCLWCTDYIARIIYTFFVSAFEMRYIINLLNVLNYDIRIFNYNSDIYTIFIRVSPISQDDTTRINKFKYTVYF